MRGNDEPKKMHLTLELGKRKKKNSNTLRLIGNFYSDFSSSITHGSLHHFSGRLRLP